MLIKSMQLLLFTDEIPEETFSPVVQAELAEGNTSNPVLGASLEPVFRCEFEFVIDTTYAYDVYWFINNQLVIVHKRIPESNINDTLLRPEDWVNDYTMNMLVRSKMVLMTFVFLKDYNLKK